MAVIVGTKIASGNTERSSTGFAIDSGATVAIYTDRDLIGLEHITAQRSFDGGTTWRPMPIAAVCDAHNREGLIHGPVTLCRVTITATAANTVVYSDA